MYQSFDAFEYIDYLRRRWLIVAVACGAAFLLSLGVSLLVPKRYTATASIVIEPPGGNDFRLSTAVSPVYLESLKTYERYAESDTLFARAAERFHLQRPGAGESIEALKRRLLSVTKLRDTKILEISATLQDPKTAQSLAQYLAEETVNSSHNESLASDRDFVSGAERQADEARARFERAQKAAAVLMMSGPIDTLKSEIDSAVESQGNLREQLVAAEADVAEYRQGTGQFAREQLQAAEARAAVLEKRLRDQERDIQQKTALYAGRVAKRDQVQNELRLAQSDYEAASKHLQDLRSSAGMHSEQLRIIDPGIVPQRPSSPNIPLNVAAALLVALLASLVYLSLGFAYRRKTVGFEPVVPRGMRA